VSYPTHETGEGPDKITLRQRSPPLEEAIEADFTCRADRRCVVLQPAGALRRKIGVLISSSPNLEGRWSNRLRIMIALRK
jgi:hypothetical protein